MRVENTTAMTMAGTLMATGIWVMAEINWAMTMPLMTPMMPPKLVSTADSVRNCQRIRFF